MLWRWPPATILSDPRFFQAAAQDAEGRGKLLGSAARRTKGPPRPSPSHITGVHKPTYQKKKGSYQTFGSGRQELKVEPHFGKFTYTAVGGPVNRHIVHRGEYAWPVQSKKEIKIFIQGESSPGAISILKGGRMVVTPIAMGISDDYAHRCLKMVGPGDYECRIHEAAHPKGTHVYAYKIVFEAYECVASTASNRSCQHQPLPPGVRLRFARAVCGGVCRGRGGSGRGGKGGCRRRSRAAPERRVPVRAGAQVRREL